MRSNRSHPNSPPRDQTVVVWAVEERDPANTTQEREILNTKLILVDGLPGSGKSTTAQFICDQLQRSGLRSRWYYEEEPFYPVASGYSSSAYKSPTDFFSASFTKWKSFVSQAMQSDEISIFESWFFQDAIFGLLMEDVEEPLIRNYIHGIRETCQCLEPVLFYLYQPDYSKTMRRICDYRGERWEKWLIERSEKSAFAQNRKLKGFDGMIQFWVKLRAIAEDIFAGLDIPKLSIDNSEREWSQYYREICDFLSIPLSIYAPSEDELSRFAGTYTDFHGGTVKEFTICLEDGELVIHDFSWLWPINRLIPKERNVFYIASYPFEMVFKEDENGTIEYARGVNPSGNWSMLDHVFLKVSTKPLTEDYLSMKGALQTRLETTSIAQLGHEEIASLLTDMSEIAHTEGIVSLSGMEEHIDDSFFKEGLILALTGTELTSTQNQLETRMETSMYLHETRNRMIIEGIASVQAGDNPKFLSARLSALYEASDTLDGPSAEGIPFSQLDFYQIKDFFVGMTETARREEILALQELVEQIDDDLMKNALQLALKGTSPDSIRDQHNSRVTILLKYHDTRYRMIIAGIQSIQFSEAPHLVRSKLENISCG